MYSRFLVCLVFCFGYLTPVYTQTNLDPQCTLTDLNGGVISLLDRDTISLRFRIRGSDNPIVGQNFQGICGVRLKFRHQNLSDLEIRLTSPNGTEVILVGPAVVGGTRPQFFQIGHDVIFRPFPNPVIPHPVLATPDFKWSNNNLDWGVNETSYDGSYYPFQGDFADFTGDDINGIWELTVSDGFLNEEGVLEEFEIEFCDDRDFNLTCDPCEAIAGSFIQDTISICEGEVYDFRDVHEVSDSDTTLHTTEIFVYNQNDRLELAGVNPDLSVLDSGTYTLHSFTILRTNYDTAKSDLQFMSRSFLIDSVQKAGGFLCMDISDAVILSVNKPNIVPVRRILCPGDTIDFRGTLITEGGIYRDTLNNCTDILELTVDASELDATFSEDTIFTDCITGIVTYGAHIRNPSGSVTYQWSEVNGSQLSQDSAFTFSRAGDYQLIVADELCDTTIYLTVEVPGVGFMLTLDATSPQFNCSEKSSILSITTNFMVDSIKWYQGETLKDEDITQITTTEIGIYKVEVYGENGCILSDSLDILLDTISPAAIVQAGDITCINQTITASYSTLDDILTASWIQNMDTISIGPEALIHEPGSFSLYLVGTNLCDTLISFEVMGDEDALEVDGVPENRQILDCNQTLLSISPIRDQTVLQEEFWVLGGNDTLQNVRDLLITTANTYEYVAIGTNGCLTSRSFDVLIDTLAPQFDVSIQDITCLQPEGIVQFSNILPQWEVDFNALGIISESDTSVHVTDSGSVDFAVRDTLNGCLTTGTVEVMSDQVLPPVILSGDTSLNCQRTVAALFADISSADLNDFYWIGPGSDTQRIADINVVNAGSYTFEALGTNGCLFQHEVIISDDRDLPEVNLPSVIDLNCANPTIQISVGNVADLNSITWINGSDTLVSNEYMGAPQAATLEVIIEGSNGCLAINEISVSQDTIVPIFNLLSDTIDCANPTVRIMADVALNNHVFTWAGSGVAGNTNNEVNVSSPGAYGLNVVDTTNGCAHLEVIDVIEDVQLPAYNVLPVDTITCEQPDVAVSLQTAPPNDVLWQTSDGRVEHGASVFTSQSGLQLFNITGPNGCAVSDSVEVHDNLRSPEVILEDTYVISCNQDQFTLTPEINDPFQELIWQFSDGRTSMTSSQTIMDDELESLTIVGMNGCETIIDFNISFSTDRPNALIENTDTLVCTGGSTDLISSPLVSPSHQLFWYEGNTPINSDLISIPISNSGTYILEVIDTSSGCFSRDTFDVTINQNPLLSVDLEVGDETCLGDNDGFIQVLNVNGGTGQVNILIDGSEVGMMPVDPVSPGSYLLEISDALGCVLDTLVNIRPGGAISVELGPDISVERGTKVSIIPQYSGELPTTVNWTGSLGTTSDHIDTLCFIPVENETIYIEAFTETGCSARDSLRVSVFVDINNISIYVPNILNLNSQTSNDRLVLSLPPDVVEVNDFSIYDRWGQLVMHVDRIVNGELIVAWDGTFNGQPVQSGVYVYRYEMFTIYDSRSRTVAGDITVID